MKSLSRTLLLFSFVLLFNNADAQLYHANPDSICINEGDPFDLNVFGNDFIEDPTAQMFIEFSQGDECFFIDDQGFVREVQGSAGSCCGTHNLTYYACLQIGDQQFCDETTVQVIVKCAKPDCSLFNMLDYQPDPLDQDAGCIDVCEGSSTTFYLPYNPSDTYNWIVAGGDTSAGANPGEFIVNWGPQGSGNVMVEVTSPLGLVSTITICVNIMEGPTANFTSSGAVCLGSPISFTNTSLNADEYDWDMGDGTFLYNIENPSHIYSAAGTYQVVLYATAFNYDSEGNQLCCCTDSIAMDVVVDPLPGPNIYWVSTLCEGDSSKYWTDAANCGSYDWLVEDEFGNVLPFDGQDNDTICVLWNIGNVGVISLQVADCDSTYCDDPTTVNVPIIPSSSVVSGPDEVCVNSTHAYSLPKWNSVEYIWTVLDVNGDPVIFDGQGSHLININWTVAGIASIHVDYHSDFLNGISDHNGTECSGTADLFVNVKPFFDLTYANTVVCPDDISFISATNTPSIDYDWSVSPSATITDLGGGNISVTWDSGPGTYVVTAMSNDTSAYCNIVESIVFEVVDIQPPLLIEGNDSICAGEPQLYTVVSGETGVGFIWNVTNGTPAFSNSSSIAVTWNGSGSISVYQYLLSSPGCSSDTISLDVIEKEIAGPLNVAGTAACTNSISNYTLSPGQLDEAQILWSVSDSTDGSIIDGQGTEDIQVQWNNDPGVVSVNVQVILCSDTLSYNLIDTIYSPIVPVISQNGILCPGVMAMLETGLGFASYVWSTGSTTNTTLIDEGGTYSVTTIDSNGCEASAYFTANEVPGAIAGISSGDNPVLCVNAGGSVDIVAQTNANYYFEWFCDGVSQGPLSATSNLIHVNTDSVQSFNYYFNVVDSLTGCINTSEIFTVNQLACGGTGCEAQLPFSVSFTNSITISPFCDDYTFTPSLSNASVFSWNFGDGTTSGANSPSHQYSEAACYNVRLTALVPAVGNSGDSCSIFIDEAICVPVAADFDFEYLGCGDVQFTDFSTYIELTDSIDSWSWSFGSTDQNPPIQNFGPGTHTITLIVTTVSGCQASASYNIVIGSVNIDSISTSSIPNPACVGDAITFSTISPNAVDWFWDFDDGATYSGPGPIHSYLSAGTYNVVLTVSDADGCTDVDSVSVLVHPGIPDLNISPGDTIACEGQTITFTAPSGFTYLWTNGATTASIDVTMTGSYGVTLTDGNNCTRDLDPVTLDFYPLPDAIISGNPIICDAGCTVLTAPFQSGYTYVWTDGTGVISTSANISVCSGSINNPYQVEVTDANGCVNISDEVNVSVAISPNFVVDVSPDACEGKPITLSINPVEPDVNYNWSNGDTGTSIVVFQAGSYTAVGTDVNTGCSFAASAIVHPLPDLCLVPTGCYEVCDPDTICGPIGLASYQWLFNGAPISGIPGMEHCLEVSVSGNYNLIASTSFGCTDTSGTLILEVVNCDPDPCDDLMVDFDYLIDSSGELDSCCVSLSYSNNTFDLAGMNIHTSDAEFIFDLTSIDPSLDEAGFDSSHISLDNVINGSPIPSGISNFLDLCFGEVYNNPQIVIIDWYDFASNIVCSDTLEFNCPIETDCSYLQSDSIYCDDNQQFVYEFTVCNPSGADFSVGYIDFEIYNPLDIELTPDSIDITGSPILPGTCQSFSFILDGDNIGGETFCYKLLTHAGNPAFDPDTDCCALDSIYCIDIPLCDPCVDVGIEAVNRVQGEDCCYAVDIYNDFDDDFFDEIVVCIISPTATLNVTNPFGSGWFTSDLTSTSVSFIPTSDGTTDGTLDLGISTLPEICLSTELAPDQMLQIKWLKDGEIFCLDTIVTSCEPDCGYLFDEILDCDSDGGWSYEASLKNMTDQFIDGVDITFVDPLFAAYNQSLSITPVAPLGIYSTIMFNIGVPGSPGDTICFDVTLHDVSEQGNHLTCCTFRHCIVLPLCNLAPDCLCESEFFDHVTNGIVCVQDISNPNLYYFQLADSSYFQDCDEVTWSYGDGSPLESVFGPVGVYHDYGSIGFEQICVRVSRVDVNGEKCAEKFCKIHNLKSAFLLYPNPSDGLVNIVSKNILNSDLTIEVRDVNDRPVFVRKFSDMDSDTNFSINVSDLSPGIYFVNFVTDGIRTVEILSKQ
ncbi:MAG: PKD repeat protein [Glaciecola sp.]|jgi:PKD repeat protein